jgi:hypothetical protein
MFRARPHDPSKIRLNGLNAYKQAAENDRVAVEDEEKGRPRIRYLP